MEVRRRVAGENLHERCDEITYLEGSTIKCFLTRITAERSRFKFWFTFLFLQYQLCPKQFSTQIGVSCGSKLTWWITWYSSWENFPLPNFFTKRSTITLHFLAKNRILWKGAWKYQSHPNRKSIQDFYGITSPYSIYYCFEFDL